MSDRLSSPMPEWRISAGVAAAVVLLATSALAELRASNSGIRGRTLLSIDCPVQRQLVPCTTRPFRAALQVKSLNNRYTRLIHTDSAGFFRVSLPPGLYELLPRARYLEDSPGNVVALSIAPNVRVRVRRAAPTLVSIRYRYTRELAINATLPTNVPPRFVVTRLGLLPGMRPGMVFPQTSPHKINDRAQVVGSTHTWDYSSVPFLYEYGRLTAIDGGQGYAMSINDSGAVVGTVGGRAFHYKSGQLTDLDPVLGLEFCLPYAINNSGQIVGSAGGTGQAFVLDATGVRLLGTPSDYSFASMAYDINDGGQIVGHTTFSTGLAGETYRHAALFEGEQVTDLGTLPGSRSSSARAINESGVIVGECLMDSPLTNVLAVYRAFAYAGGQMTDLGVLPGITSSWAFDVNNAGWIVGLCEDLVQEGPPHSRACLYIHEKLYDLNDLIPHDSVWELLAATSVNERGQIVGYGMRNGKRDAFLLTPVTLSTGW